MPEEVVYTAKWPKFLLYFAQILLILKFHSDGDADTTKKKAREDMVPALAASYRNILKHVK